MNTTAHYGVLLVEDIEKERKGFLIYLRKCDLNIFSAKDFESAAKVLEQNHKNIGLIISDYKIPQEETNGLEFLQKCSEKYPEIVRILTTAHSHHQLAIDALNSGAIYRYILKPWNENTFPQEILKGLDYFILKNERDFLARERIVTLQKIILSDTLRNIATLALGLSNHINNPVAGFRKFISLLPPQVLSQEVNVSQIELKKVMKNSVKKNYMFGELIKHIKDTVVSEGPKFKKVNFANILKKSVKDIEMPKELTIKLEKTESVLKNIQGNKQILTNMVKAVIDYLIDAKAKLVRVKTEKAVLFDEIDGIKISFIVEKTDRTDNIWNTLPIIFAVYHHNGIFGYKKSNIEICLPLNPDSAKDKFDNSMDKLDRFFEQFETIKYYEAWLSVIK